MKQLIYATLIVFLAAACGKKTTDKKTELAELKKQQVEISQKIAALEAETGTKDSVKETRSRCIALGHDFSVGSDSEAWVQKTSVCRVDGK